MNRAQVYERVAAGILERLESGVAPWHQPWDPAHGRPRNFVSGRPYSGVNAFALGLAGRSPYWLTLNQANRMGFRLRKGSKGVPILFYTRREVEEPGRDADGKPAVVVRAVSLVRVYWVFNALDVDGLQLPAPEARPLQGIAAADAMVASIRPVPAIVHGSSRAAFVDAVRNGPFLLDHGLLDHGGIVDVANVAVGRPAIVDPRLWMAPEVVFVAYPLHSRSIGDTRIKEWDYRETGPSIWCVAVDLCVR